MRPLSAKPPQVSGVSTTNAPRSGAGAAKPPASRGRFVETSLPDASGRDTSPAWPSFAPSLTPMRFSQPDCALGGGTTRAAAPVPPRSDVSSYSAGAAASAGSAGRSPRRKRQISARAEAAVAGSLCRSKKRIGTLPGASTPSREWLHAKRQMADQSCRAASAPMTRPDAARNFPGASQFHSVTLNGLPKRRSHDSRGTASPPSSGFTPGWVAGSEKRCLPMKDG